METGAALLSKKHSGACPQPYSDALVVDFSLSASLSSFSSLTFPCISLSSIFLEIQVSINNELDIYLFHFMDSVMLYMLICLFGFITQEN